MASTYTDYVFLYSSVKTMPDAETRATVSFYCPNCGTRNIIRDLEAGEEVCGECGLVLSNIVEEGAEWRAFEISERGRGRAEITTKTTFDAKTSTRFNAYKDGRGKLLNIEAAERMKRLQKVDNISKLNNSKDRNLAIALSLLSRISSSLHLPESVISNTALLYRKALDKDLIKGRSIDSTVAACIYACCRMSGVPRSMKMIADASQRDLKEVSRIYRLIFSEMELKMPTNRAELYIPGIVSKLGLGIDVEHLAVGILREARRLRVTLGKDPEGLAGTAVYIAVLSVGETRTQKAIAEAAGTSEVTLRNRKRTLVQELGLNIRGDSGQLSEPAALMSTCKL